MAPFPLKVLALASVAFIALPAGIALAAPSGYGPRSPTGPGDTPGGYTDVITSQTIGVARTTVNVTSTDAPTTITVPAGAVPTGDQLTVTQPTLSQVQSALPNDGFSGYKALVGIGIGVTTPSGQAYTGAFEHPITVSVDVPAALLDSGVNLNNAEALELSASGATVIPMHFTPPDTLTFTISHDPNIAIVAPTATSENGAASSSVTPPERHSAIGHRSRCDQQTDRPTVRGSQRHRLRPGGIRCSAVRLGNPATVGRGAAMT